MSRTRLLSHDQAARYIASPRRHDDILRKPEYSADHEVRRVTMAARSAGKAA
jgi:hypothetical protein